MSCRGISKLASVVRINLRKFSSSVCSPAADIKAVEREVKEVSIPVPWGHIAGKWWGNPDVQPILGLHGWEDNACTFDPLIPLLNVESFLAIDVIGHGMSSHLPQGRCYNFLDFILMVKMIQKHYGWQKISFLGHSMGSSIAFFYSGIFPDLVDKYISVECARTLAVHFPGLELEQLRKPINKMFSVEEKLGSAPPSYGYEEMIKLVHKGSLESINLDSCKLLMQRGAIEYTNENGKKGFYFSRDPRLREQWLGRATAETVITCASRITCDVLSFRAKNGFLFNSMSEDAYLKSLENMKRSARRFEHHEVEGSHHVHLNNPENVAPLINEFLNNCIN